MNKNDSKSFMEGCLSNISHQSNLMKHCLSENNLLQALKHCSNFLNELRINQLSPKQYYELYVAIFDSLDYLSNHLLSSYKLKQKKTKENVPFLADLYELVQYSGNIIPRLYMMIVIGTTYMATNDAPTKEIMKDMIEMCRGVQNPIRGLFLRYYLSQRIKDLLPLSNEAEFNETTDFLITNFIEMNKLWVRLQHQGHSSERQLRTMERKELKILVGSNLVRLSQIIDDYSGENYAPVDYYKERIFPTITEQIIQCKDYLAQSYLVDVLIQIFPDSFHFATLDDLLNRVFMNLNPALNKSELISTLIERFITFNKFESDNNHENEAHNIELFNIFWNFYLKLAKLEMPIEEHSLILQSFIKLSLIFESDNYDNLNDIYQFITENFTSEDKQNEEVWLNLLIAPIQNFNNVLKLLELSFFSEFYSKISNVHNQKKISIEILSKLLELDEIKVTSVEELDAIFKYLLILIKDDMTEVNMSKKIGLVQTVKIENGEKAISNDALTIQSNICKILQLVNRRSRNYFRRINDLIHIKKKYLNKNLANIIYTYPTVIGLILNNLRIIGLVNTKSAGAYTTKLIHQYKNLSIIIDELYKYHSTFSSSLCLSLFLNTASVADQARLSSIANELFTKSFIIYEENLAISNATVAPTNDPLSSNSVSYESVILMAINLAAMRHLSQEDYETLITKLTLYGSRLLKKQDQCRAVSACSHLWWWTEKLTNDEDVKLYQEPKRVLECLQKALKVADSCLDPYLTLQLFVEILNRCLCFVVYGNDLIDAHYVNGLIDLIRTNFDNLREDGNLNKDDNEYRMFTNIQAYFNRSLAYIQQQKEESRFLDIMI